MGVSKSRDGSARPLLQIIPKDHVSGTLEKPFLKDTVQRLSLQGITVSFQRKFKHTSFESLLMARAEEALRAALGNSLLHTCRSLITFADQIIFTEHLTQVNTAVSSAFRLAAVTHWGGQDKNKAGVRKA